MKLSHANLLIKGRFILHVQQACTSYHSSGRDTTGFTKGYFFFNLKYPIGNAKKNKVHFSELIKKIQCKLQVWKGKIFF